MLAVNLLHPRLNAVPIASVLESRWFDLHQISQNVVCFVFNDGAEDCLQEDKHGSGLVVPDVDYRLERTLLDIVHILRSDG